MLIPTLIHTAEWGWVEKDSVRHVRCPACKEALMARMSLLANPGSLFLPAHGPTMATACPAGGKWYTSKKEKLEEEKNDC